MLVRTNDSSLVNKKININDINETQLSSFYTYNMFAVE